MNQKTILFLLSFVTLSLSLNLHSVVKRFEKNPKIRYSRQNTIPDIGIPLDWIEESPVDGNEGSVNDNKKVPNDDLPVEYEEENGDSDGGAGSGGDYQQLDQVTERDNSDNEPTNYEDPEYGQSGNFDQTEINTEESQDYEAKEPQEEVQRPKDKGTDKPQNLDDYSDKEDGVPSPEDVNSPNQSEDESIESTQKPFKGNDKKKNLGMPSTLREAEDTPELPIMDIPKGPSKLVEICDKPVVINAANRYTNSTVRLFRGNSFWDLMGLPDRKAFTSEKNSLSAPMAPVPPKTSIVTIMEGSDKLKGKTYKFQKQFFWSWDEEGKQVRGGKGGEYWSEIPKGGFDTMFHNANQSKPMIIGFKDDSVYYLSTKDQELEFIDPDGKLGGKFKENFPPGLTAAFTWPLEAGLKVYLFRDDSYCMRDVETPPDGKDCPEWRDTSELFGCIQTKPPTTASTTMKPVVTEVETSTEMLITEAPAPPSQPQTPQPPQPAVEETPSKPQTTAGSGSAVSTIGLASLSVSFFVLNF